MIEQWGGGLSYDGTKDIISYSSENSYVIFLESRDGYANRDYTGTYAKPVSASQFKYTFRYGTSDTGNVNGFWRTIGY